MPFQHVLGRAVAWLHVVICLLPVPVITAIQTSFYRRHLDLKVCNTTVHAITIDTTVDTTNGMQGEEVYTEAREP
jgi:hypothetical protein